MNKIDKIHKNEITLKLLNSLFEYKNGKLYYKKDSGNGVKYKGDEAGSFNSLGYKSIKIDGISYYEHRLIFIFYNGYIPKFLDHIDGNPLNNKIENLRECSHSQNMMNKKIQINNISGVKGVSWNSKLQKWIAKINIDGKRIYLGTFYSIELAESVINKLRKEHHKEFARYS